MVRDRQAAVPAERLRRHLRARGGLAAFVLGPVDQRDDPLDGRRVVPGRDGVVDPGVALDVELEIEEYARSLSEAVNAQISAEGHEIDFYELLEQDSTLENGRTEAEDILSEVDEGYEEAEEAYERAQEIADANPELLRERY